MSRVLEVHVTREDIAEGVREASQHCPVARAMRAAGAREAAASALELDWIDASGTGWKARTPDAVAEFIDRYDTNGLVGPIDFTVIGERCPPPNVHAGLFLVASQ